MIIILGTLLMLSSLIIYFYSFYFLLLKLGYYIQWELLEINGYSFEMIILLDWVSMVFMGVVFMISSMVMFYSVGYMLGDLYSFRFFKLLILFVISMIFLIISPNIVSILIGWDGLGLVSYCLVIYYSSYMSYNYGLITFLCNRVGDVGILLLISLFFSSGGGNMMFYDNLTVISTFFLVVSSMTKSAQIPFSTWLPKAMAAPTPVSSLVHSSTLVTAGIYLMIRYNIFLMKSTLLMSMLLILSSMTMLMSGLAACVESDLKKIIAFSTLSQLGLMMSILSMGQSMLAFFHLLTHAMFKSLMFLSAGCIIHGTGSSNQDIRLMGGMIKSFPFVVMVMFCASCSLGGFPFLSGFYSKDLIMEYMIMSKLNMVSVLMLLVGTMLTVSYSVRMFMYMVLGKGKIFSLVLVYNNYMMNFSMLVLYVMSVLGGSVLSFVYFDSVDLIFLPLIYKVMILLICLLGVVVGVLLYYTKFMNFSKIVNYLGFMWFFDYLSSFVYKFLMIGGYSGYNFDKVWLENTNKNLINNLILLGSWISSNTSKEHNFNLFGLIQYMLFLLILLCLDF